MMKNDVDAFLFCKEDKLESDSIFILIILSDDIFFFSFFLRRDELLLKRVPETMTAVAQCANIVLSFRSNIDFFGGLS